MLSKTDGLIREQLARKHPPSELTLAGLLYHLSLVEEDWMEVRFAALPDREPWANVDSDPIRCGPRRPSGLVPPIPPSGAADSPLGAVTAG